MCGIFGYIGTGNVPVKKVTDTIVHRGPNAEGFLGYSVTDNVLKKDHQSFDALSGVKVLFGFRRLSIIDLRHDSDQPMSFPDKGLHIIFNGEIYNYLELKSELQAKGHVFTTHSDTEVLLHAYSEWGSDCLNKLNGMWAFAVLDTVNRKVFCARDRFGVKPFYLYASANSLMWASEIKQFFAAGVQKEINENVIRDFLDKTLTDHTVETFFKNIVQLRAGHYLEIDLNQQTDYTSVPQYRYWNLSVNAAYTQFKYEDAKNEFRRLFSDSIKLRFRSDVQVGSCLSGGLDSSAIVSQAATLFEKPFQSFTSVFTEKAFDESYYAKLVNQKYPNVVPRYCSLDENTLKNEIDQVIYYQDEPFGTFGIMAQWEVMKLAKANQVTVLLDGQGGDEQLGGYRKFYAFYLKELLQQKRLGDFIYSASFLLKNREFNFFNKEGIYRYLGLTKQLNYLSDEGKKLPPGTTIGLTSSKDMRSKSKEDIERFSFPPLLRFEDRNSMAHSIEARVPFMDYRLVEFLYSISSDYKIRKGYTKAILRDSLAGVLPDETAKRISKLGFATPQSVWMKDKLKGYFHQAFSTLDNPYLSRKDILADFEKYPDSSMHSWDFSRFFIFDKWFSAHFK